MASAKTLKAKLARKKRIQPIPVAVVHSMHPYALRFEIRGLPPNANASGGSRNFWAISAERKLWIKAIDAFIAPHLPRQPLLFAKLTLSRHSTISPDPDGLVGGFKSVVDALVQCGVLVNDRFENIGMPNYSWAKCKAGEGRIFVTVEE